MDLAVVAALWIGATLMIGVIPAIHRHNATKNLNQTTKDVHTLLTPNETIVHIARQGNISGWSDTVVATNNRIIIHRIKWRWWGKAVFEDVAWEDVQKATTEEGIGIAHFRLLTTDGHKLMVGNLVKAQAQALLVICNERIKQGEGLGTEQVDAPKLETLSKKTDSDNPSRGATGFGQDTRITVPETRSMYCPNCGAESDESANFCRDCGQALSDGEQKTSDSLPEHSAKSEEPSEDAPSSTPPSKTEDEKEQKTAVSTKQVIGCLAIPAAIVLLIIVGSWGSDPVSDCWGSRGESIFKNAIRSRLNDPDSLRFHDTRTQEVEGQPRTAILVEYSANNLFGGRVRKTAVGYLEEAEGAACIPVIVSMG